MRALAAAVVALAALASGCFGAPDYEGRACFPNEPCPEAYACGADARCHAGAADAGGGEDAGAADASNVDPARCTDPANYPDDGWEARYYYLPLSMEIDPGACFGVENLAGEFLSRNYGFEGPTPDVLTFASTYTGRRVLGPGVISFRVFHDDGMRVFLDDRAVYDHWHVITNPTNVRSMYLERRSYAVRVEHFDSGGVADVELSWASACDEVSPPASGGWALRYYRLDAAQAIDRADCFGTGTVLTATVGADYGESAPQPVRSASVHDQFAVVGTSRHAFSGMVRFLVRHDDGLRLTFGTEVLYDARTAGPTRTATVTATLQGEEELGFEYFDYSGSAGFFISYIE